MQADPQFKALIIHLDRAVERRANIKKLIETLPCSVEIISAVDYRNLIPETIGRIYQRKLFSPKYPFVLSRNEIACFLSHRKAWAAIVDANLDFGLIIEDDVCLTSDFKPALDLALAHADNDSFIRFPFRERETGKLVAHNQNIRLIKPDHVGLGQVAQLVGKEAARKLLAQSEQFDRPIDSFMQLFWQTSIHPLSVLPGGVREISAELGGSLLKCQHGLNAKLRREILRPIYRWKIKFLSKRRCQ